MIGIDWVTNNWEELLQNVGIISGLIFTGHAALVDARYRKVQTLATLTKSHREIWSAVYSHPELARVLADDVDLETSPPTPPEQIFVRFLILHLASAYEAQKSAVIAKPENLAEDIRSFLSLPVPAHIWRHLKEAQDADFVRFVEKSRSTN